MAEYPPYVNAYGTLCNLFEEIKKASVPPKFTQDYIATVLGLKSSSYRAMIPLLKRLGFLDQANIPTPAYKAFRDDDSSGKVMAEQIKQAYTTLYSAHEYAHKLSKQELISKLKTLLGVGDDDKVLPTVAGTFLELCKLADFEAQPKDPASKGGKDPEKERPEIPTPPPISGHTKLGLSYTINLNLPATTEIEVFNAIFKSLKEHIIDQK